MTQKNVFLDGEGDAWFRRNQATVTAPGRDDRVPDLVERIAGKPRRVLEVGSSNGWRLQVFRERFGAGVACCGIDPSAAAIEDGRQRHPTIDLRRGTADTLPFEPGSFDVVIFGHCLYLCDPADFFRVVTEADRVLAERGLLVIVDFNSTFPFRNTYMHKAGVHSIKMDWSRLFSAHPAYALVHREFFSPDPDKGLDPDYRHAIDVLFKDTASAFPDNPFKPRT